MSEINSIGIASFIIDCVLSSSPVKNTKLTVAICAKIIPNKNFMSCMVLPKLWKFILKLVSNFIFF